LKRFFAKPNFTAKPISQLYESEVRTMNILLIEAIFDRYVAKAQKRAKAWSPAEGEALLLKWRMSQITDRQ
jgi:hypothetical protein